MGEGVGDINPFATCSPASFAPVSATELVLGFGMSATAAGHAEMQAHTRMSATINGGTVFIRLNVLLSFAQFEREVTGERVRDKIAASLIEPSSAVKSKLDHAQPQDNVMTPRGRCEGAPARVSTERIKHKSAADGRISASPVPSGRRKCASMRTIFEFPAENAKITDWLAERSHFELSGDFD